MHRDAPNQIPSKVQFMGGHVIKAINSSDLFRTLLTVSSTSHMIIRLKRITLTDQLFLFTYLHLQLGFGDKWSLEKGKIDLHHWVQLESDTSNQFPIKSNS